MKRTINKYIKRLRHFERKQSIGRSKFKPITRSVTQKVRGISTSKATFRIVKIKNGIVYCTRGGCLNVISADRAHPNFCGSNLRLTPGRPSLPTYRSSHIVFKSNISYQKKVPVEALDLLETHTNERAHHSLAYVERSSPFARTQLSAEGVSHFILQPLIFSILFIYDISDCS